MLVRPMARGDVAEVTELCGQLSYPSTAAQVAHRFDLLEHDREHALFVAQAPDGKVVGWVHAHEVRLMESDPLVEIWGLVVDAAHHRQGVGQALMRCAEEWASQRGYAEVRLRSNVVRTEAHRFYQHLGYQISKTSYTFEKSLQV
jgi:GNAT superfamily N-acetyltransferase